jgi:8-oxo-dGTP pyrophosphatase MutT (NUDIX family)
MMANFEPIRLSLEESVKLDESHIHAAHCLIYTGSGQDIFALMQMRSDGKIGFPGGTVDEVCPSIGEIVCALNRELMEEINYEASIDLDCYVMSHLHLTPSGKKLITHFFMKRIALEEDFRRIERDHSKAPYFPEESLGLFRVPLFPNEPKFLANFAQMRFAGNALDQLLEAFQLIRESLNL